MGATIRTGRTPNKIVPEITDVRCGEEDKDERLRENCREENRGSSNSANKKSCQEQAKDAAVENRTQNVTGFDEIFDQTRK